MKTKRMNHRKHNKSCNHKKKHSQRGGYSSATTFVEDAVGTTNAQYNRTFDIGSGNINSNRLIGAQGQYSTLGGSVPSAQNLALIQSAGRKKHRHRGKSYNRGRNSGTRRKKGGFGTIFGQAAAPLALLAMQQTYRPTKTFGQKKKYYK